MKQPLIIAIAGGSASGKTSIAKQLYQSFQGQHRVVIIKQDDYYKDQSHLTYEQRVKTNYDHPLAFDTDLLIQHLKQLQRREKIIKPIYDFTQHNRSQKTETIDARDIILLEGILVLDNKDLRDLCDILVYVDTECDIRFIRRLKRDMEERGRSLENICNHYLTTVRPMHEQFIEPSKKYAHIIIPEGGENHVAVDLLITKMRSILEIK